MCNVIVYDGNTETIIPGGQINSLQMPFEFDFYWFPDSGTLQLINNASPQDIIVGSTTYDSYDKVRYHGSTATLTTESGNEVLNLYPTHTDQPPNYTINGFTYQAGVIQEVIFDNFQASIASQTLVFYPLEELASLRTAQLAAVEGQRLSVGKVTPLVGSDGTVVQGNTLDIELEVRWAGRKEAQTVRAG